jgi:hypothetical protein
LIAGAGHLPIVVIVWVGIDHPEKEAIRLTDYFRLINNQSVLCPQNQFIYKKQKQKRWQAI